MALDINAIELNKRYPVHIAESDQSLLTFHYTFKPASVSKATHGSINYAGENVTVTVPTTSEASVVMKGVANQKINECVLAFNGKQFTLLQTDMQGSVVGLKPERSEDTTGFNVSKVKIAKFVPSKKRKVPCEEKVVCANKKQRAIEAVRSVISSAPS